MPLLLEGKEFPLPLLSLSLCGISLFLSVSDSVSVSLSLCLSSSLSLWFCVRQSKINQFKISSLGQKSETIIITPPHVNLCQDQINKNKMPLDWISSRNSPIPELSQNSISGPSPHQEDRLTSLQKGYSKCWMGPSMYSFWSQSFRKCHFCA